MKLIDADQAIVKRGGEYQAGGFPLLISPSLDYTKLLESVFFPNEEFSVCA